MDGMVLCEEAAEHFEDFVHRAAKNYAIGAGEIDVLENALLERFFGCEMDGLDAHFRDAHHFAGLDLADVLRVKQIEGAGFGSDEPGVEAAGSSEFSENERAEAARVAHGVKFIFRENEKRVGAFDLIEGVANRAGKIASLRTGDEMD